jgi:uncharacterized membrane protein (UPF0127 family)
VEILNITRGTELASRARLANRFWSRGWGLLGRARLEPGEGLVLEPCSSIHTAFMRFTIDVLFADRTGRVVKAVPSLKPFRLSLSLASRYTIELPVGTIARTGTVPGDMLKFETEESSGKAG